MSNFPVLLYGVYQNEGFDTPNTERTNALRLLDPHNRITRYPPFGISNKLIANYGQGALTGICQIPRAKDKARLHKGALWLVQGDPGTLKYYGTKLVALVAWPLLRATSLSASAWIENWLK